MKPRLLHFDPDYETADIHSGGLATLLFARAAIVFVVGSGAYVWIRLGGSVTPLIAGLVIAAALYLLMDWRLARELKTESPGRPGGCIAWLFWLGVPIGISAAMLLVNLGIYVSHAWTVVLFFAVMFVLLLRSLRAGELKLPDWEQGACWLFMSATLLAGPLFLGWIAASFVLLFAQSENATVKAWLDNHQTSRRSCPDWKVDGKPARVAVMLSGGGYRAAVSHAGVLAALDEQCVPIHILSTVSGGSIIGAAYALGVPPREFANRLRERRPGLPDALLTIQNVLKRNTRVYEEHLARVYFGDRDLNQLPDVPLLLVNATNVYTDTTFAREILSKRWMPRKVPIKIATAVAASGAFPAAFGPVRVPWFSDERHLLDGGILENLGVDGLRRHLHRHMWTEWYQERPLILVISDASGYAGDGDRLVINPSADDILLRANAIQFDELHRMIYAELTGEDDLRLYIASQYLWKQYYKVEYPNRFLPEQAAPVGRPSQPLVTVVIPVTATSTRTMLEREAQCIGPGAKQAAEVHAAVTGFSTLRELTAAEVEQAYWLGHALGRLYGQAIECARRDLNGVPCTLSSRPVPMNCP